MGASRAARLGTNSLTVGTWPEYLARRCLLDEPPLRLDRELCLDLGIGEYSSECLSGEFLNRMNHL